MWIEPAFIVGTYLFGSIPVVYLLGRLRGVDLRGCGSGNVGGGNLWQTVGPLEGIIGGLSDIAKGAFPVLAARALHFSAPGLALVAAAALAGQMLPVFLRFQGGGRGNATALGIAACLIPRELGLSLIVMILGAIPWLIPRLLRFSQSQRFRFQGARSRSVPLAMLAGFCLLPVLSWRFGEPLGSTLAATSLAVLIIIRRMTAGVAKDLREATDKKPILVNRFLYDRSYLRDNQGKSFTNGDS